MHKFDDIAEGAQYAWNLLDHKLELDFSLGWHGIAIHCTGDADMTTRSELDGVSDEIHQDWFRFQ